MKKTLLIAPLFLLLLIACQNKPSQTANTNQEQNLNTALKNEITYPLANQIDQLSSQPSFTIKGTATAEVQDICIFVNGENCEHYISGPQDYQPGDQNWQFTVSNDPNEVAPKIICKGKNVLDVYFSPEAGNCSADLAIAQKQIAFNSEVGYDGLADYPTAAIVAKLISNKNIIVENDASLITQFDMAPFCNNLDKVVVNGDRETYFSKTQEVVALKPINNSQNLYAKVRTSLANKDLNNSQIGESANGKIGYNGMGILEFYTKDNNKYQLAQNIPSFNWLDCDEFAGGFKVYYYKPNLIMLVASGGHESSDGIYYWQTNKWLNVRTLVMEKLKLSADTYLAPFSLKANKQYFSLTETAYCCDSTPWLYLNKKTELIFDTSTFTLIDAVLHDLSL